MSILLINDHLSGGIGRYVRSLISLEQQMVVDQEECSP